MKPETVTARLFRLLRFGLRGLLTGLLTLCILLGWRVEHMRRQQSALRELLQQSRHMISVGPTGRRLRERDLEDRWIPALLGKSWFADDLVIIVHNSSGRLISDGELDALRQLRGLRKLIYTAQTSDVERLQASLPNCDVCPLTISHRFQLDVF